MAIKYGFFNSVNGDRVYDAEDLGRYLHGIISSGVYADSSDSLQVLANGDMTVTVQPGRAMLDCHYMENDAPLVLNLEPAGTTSRHDAVVMRLDKVARTCGIYVKTNVPVTLTPGFLDWITGGEANVKEWVLAYIYVGARATAITQSAITDHRANTSLCGWVHGLVDQVDTSTLFLQWQTAYEEQYAELQQARANMEGQYYDWFAGLPEGDEINKLPITTPAHAGHMVLVNPDGTGYTVGGMPFAFKKDAEYPDCYSRVVGNEKEWLNPPKVWSAKNDDYAVYAPRRTAERWSDASGVQKPVYEMRVDVFKLPSQDSWYGHTGYTAPLPDGAECIHCSGTYISNDRGVQPFPVVAQVDGDTIALSAFYQAGALRITNGYSKLASSKGDDRAEFVIKYVL